MSNLARADLNQVPLDLDSFIGRAVTAGLEYEQLPPRFMDTLMVYLRIRGMDYARRQRTGITIGKDQLRKGIEMGLICMDLALEQEAAGDLNVAVELLSAGQFEGLYSQGWELAFGQLEAMRERSIELARHPELAFWPEAKSQVKAWAQLTPETWCGTDDEGKTVAIDLTTDAATLREWEGKVAFLRSLPERSVKALLKRVEVDFSGVVHRVILALALGRMGLVADRELVGRFRDECCEQDTIRADLRQQVLEQVTAHLDHALQDAEVRALIAGEFREGLELIERAAAGNYLDELFLPPEQFYGGEAARQAADADANGE